MHLNADYTKHLLQFKFAAGTSRGVLTERYAYFVRLISRENPQLEGWGEASPLSGLSIDDRPDFEQNLQKFIRQIKQVIISQNTDNQWVSDMISPEFPAIRFAFETAWLDIQNGGKRLIFDNQFSQGKQALTINGLIWMGKPDFMQKQIEDKLIEGFTCLKMKIGAIDFAREVAILKAIRARFSAQQITLRVDANGAFTPAEALEKLKILSDMDLHSIEQPIRAGQVEEMAQLCQTSPLPIALDEELIGVWRTDDKRKLLQTIRPPYIILKPTLLGGFRSCEEWITVAEKLLINWWMTSALEANIGLNAISQFTAQWANPLPQGLGTGALYHNNLESPLTLKGEQLSYDPRKNWESPQFALPTEF
ncbi:MAG: o-succinylbenzoate synthase [Microscillaceae bacterium]|jgi:o-succinylbenzoate synthase|nr:o-succinylbenzoate synthase [Microscillaceae bacterium]